MFPDRFSGSAVVLVAELALSEGGAGLIVLDVCFGCALELFGFW